MAYSTDVDFKIIKPDTSFEEAVQYVKTNFYKLKRNKWSLKKTSKLCKLLCDMEFITPSAEQYIYMLTNYRRVLNEACAGAGKTTMSKYRMILANICWGIPGKNILAIAYNKHAAQDIANKYQITARRINAAIPPRNADGSFSHNPIHVDTDIISTTMHAWCLTWVKQYRARWQYANINLLLDDQQHNVMQRCFQITMKKLGKQETYFPKNSVNALLQLYAFVGETLSREQPEKWNLCSARQELKVLNNTEIIQVFETYDRHKELTKVMDYNDLILKMWELVCDPEVLARLRNVYKFVLVDEYQDITPAMSRILHVLMEGNPALGLPYYEEGYLTVIGDGDQSIYGFRGTDSDNCIRFKEEYSSIEGHEDEVKITAMSINRRCKKNILEKATAIITSNDNRIDKPLQGLHEGGNVDISYYNSETDEITKVIKLLQEPGLQLNKTCICYRNLISSQHLAMRLMDVGIPIDIRRGVSPFTDIYTKTIDGVLIMLEQPNIAAYAQEHFYKVVPKGAGFTKQSLYKMFQEQIDKEKNSRRGNYCEPKNFFEYDYTDWRSQNGFSNALETLRRAHLAIRANQPMQNFMGAVLNLIRRYYIDGLRKGVLQDKISDEYLRYIDEYYQSSLPYRSFKKEKTQVLASLEDNKNSGVILTTMHGLKGLEFDNVIVIDLQDTLYPGTELKGDHLTPEQVKNIELESRRLLYVTVTRAKTNLHLLFHKTNPTRYIKFFVENDNISAMHSHSKAQNGTALDNADLTSMFDDNLDEEFVFEEDLVASVPMETELTDVSDDFNIDFDVDFPEEDDGLSDVSLEDPEDTTPLQSNLEDNNKDDALKIALGLVEEPEEEEKPMSEVDDPKSPLYKKPRVATLLDLLRNKGGNI